MQHVVELIFERFRLDGSAAAVLRYLIQQGVRLPLRDNLSDELRWKAPRYHRVLQILRNPLYTGAYVYGRRQSRRALVDGEVHRRRTTELPVESWQICLRDHHPAYVSWAPSRSTPAHLKRRRRGASDARRATRPTQPG